MSHLPTTSSASPRTVGSPASRATPWLVVSAAAVTTMHLLLSAARALRDLARNVRRDERGQATTEYALVLLAAALVALLVIAWATAGGGAARIARLFDSVIDAVIDRV